MRDGADYTSSVFDYIKNRKERLNAKRRREGTAKHLYDTSELQ